jgi:N-acetylmuramic acid 6-phosphate etherase
MSAFEALIPWLSFKIEKPESEQALLPLVNRVVTVDTNSVISNAAISTVMASEPPLSSLSTELPNPATTCIDRLNSLDLVTLINAEDTRVIECIRAVLPDIARAIDETTPRLRNGGRVIYFGAGTSGRLGVLDASECVPTFNCNQFVAIMAGGNDAVSKAC